MQIKSAHRRHNHVHGTRDDQFAHPHIHAAADCPTVRRRTVYTCGCLVAAASFVLLSSDAILINHDRDSIVDSTDLLAQHRVVFH